MEMFSNFQATVILLLSVKQTVPLDINNSDAMHAKSLQSRLTATLWTTGRQEGPREKAAIHLSPHSAASTTVRVTVGRAGTTHHHTC